MMRSLFSGVSGIKTHQTRLDVSGNNISNVNTVGYKSQSVNFKDVYYQTTQTATGPNAETGKGGTNAMQIGLGSSVGSISTSTIQGATERTDDPYDLCLSGESYFIVSNSGSTYFTRAGDFTVDANGALVTSGGANVMGWQVDDDGNVVKDQVSALYVTSPEFTYTSPTATAGISLSGNIKNQDSDAQNFTIYFYDSVGNEYQASVTAKYSETTGAESHYTITGGTITKNGVATGLTLTASGDFTFNANNGVAMEAMSNLYFTIEDPNGTNPIDLENIGVAEGNERRIYIDASQMTSYNSSTKIESSRGITGDGTDAKPSRVAGKAAGKMTSVGVDSSGHLVASYNNGDVRYIGQIAVTTFANAAGLEKTGENLYSATLNSGTFDGIGVDVSTTGGSITSGYLEMSNVDLSSEFTTLITTQRGYQASSRIITVSDTLLEELINLKR